MKMCKYGEALAFQDPLACIRIHGKNFHDDNRKMFLDLFFGPRGPKSDPKSLNFEPPNGPQECPQNAPQSHDFI